MGLISDILGGLRPGAKPAKRSIAEVEKALQRLAAKRTDAREAVAKAMREREALLLVDDLDKKIAELDAAADRHRLVIERMERAEPLLIAELQSLRTEARQARWSDLRTRYQTAARDYGAALRAAIVRQDRMLALNDEARASGFEQETIACFTPPMRVLTAGALNEFEQALDRRRDAEEAMRAPPPPKAAPVTQLPVNPATKLRDAPRSASQQAAPAARPPPRPPIDEAAGEGLKRYTIVRNGVELEGRPVLAVGDTVALKPAEGDKLLRSGAADLAANGDERPKAWGVR